jgi:hypothetical protein
MAWCPSQPGLGWSWPPAGREVKAMLFCSTSARVAGSGTVSHSYRHGSDVAADGHFESGFLAAAARVRAMVVEPGCEQSRWLPVAVDERRPDVLPEYRGPVVAAAGIAAARVATMLPEPVPQGGAAGSSQRVRADPHHAAAAVAADLAVFEEESVISACSAGRSGQERQIVG